MISKQYIKSLEFEDLTDLFNYIVDSETNGAITQARELTNKLSNSQFKEFKEWLKEYDINAERFIKWRLE